MSFIKSLVLPHPHLKKRSYLLQHKAFFGYIIFLILLIFLSRQLTTAMPGVLGYAENIKIGELLSETNKLRASKGRGNLTLNTNLSRAAEAKAKDMFNKGYWAHTSPDGKEPWDFIIASGYDYLYAGENLAVDFNDSDSVVAAWYDSSSHRENLLNDKYSEIGFAVVDGELNGRKTTLVVQMFGYPRSRPAAVSSANTQVPTEIPAVAEPVVQVEEVVEIAQQEELVEPAMANDVVPGEVVRGGRVLNSADVFNVSRFIAILLGLFLTAILAIDGYYVRQMGIYRISGHTLLHLLMLVAAIAGIWYTHIGLVL